MVLRFVAEDGTPILVGESAIENDQLCRRASQRDLWFHLDGRPSPHVILQLSATVGKRKSSTAASTSAAAIRDACQLCKAYSRGPIRRAPTCAIIYVEAKHVGKVKGKGGVVADPSGRVHLSRAPTRTVVGTNEEVLERLEATKSAVATTLGDFRTGGNEGGVVTAIDDGPEGFASSSSSCDVAAIEPLFAPKPSREERKASAARRRAERKAAKTKKNDPEEGSSEL